MYQVVKRDGKIADFDLSKIRVAITKAFEATHKEYNPDIIDLLLVAVLPEYQNKGVNALLFADLIPICQKMGFKFGETHPQLETNEKSQGQWAYLDAEVHKQRRCYQKSLK